MCTGSCLCPQPRWLQRGRKCPHVRPPRPLFLPWRSRSRWWRDGGRGWWRVLLGWERTSPRTQAGRGFRPGGKGIDMSLEDPFFVVRGEVQKAVNTARGLYQRWCELLQESAAVGREELDWTTNELRNGLRSIEWDLEDLEETIGIVEANPGKPAPQKSLSDLLDASAVSATSRYIEEQQATQQLIMDEQDQQLEMVSGSIQVLKHMSGRVGEELDEQGIMLDAFAQEMDHTQSRMDGVLRKLAKVSHMTSDRRQWCAIAALVGVLLLVLILLFSL
ncbi:PREDICTED: syntaxin-10 isoform X3 [Mandrillus leucophaeus]|nr:PREDICTED: syntaxin-10 isoform X3 [Mandrillus leucophaeus]